MTIDPMLVTNRLQSDYRQGGTIMFRKTKKGAPITGLIEFINADGSMRVRTVATGRHVVIQLSLDWGCYRALPKKRGS